MRDCVVYDIAALPVNSEAFVADPHSPDRRSPRLSVRGLIVLVLLLGLAFGWASSERRLIREQRVNYRRMLYVQEELGRARQELDDKLSGPRPDRTRAFWEADLDGFNLAGMTIASKGNAFQRASFRKGRLEGTTLEGGDAAFQFANFDAAKLSLARLTGAHASFQRSSFVGADLSGAVLSGGSSSFQNATFEEANLVGARLSGNFQSVNLSGARLEGADLTGIQADDLASCLFLVPPTYDARTRFPTGFDPVANLWRKVEGR